MLNEDKPKEIKEKLLIADEPKSPGPSERRGDTENLSISPDKRSSRFDLSQDVTNLYGEQLHPQALSHDDTDKVTEDRMQEVKRAMVNIAVQNTSYKKKKRI